MLFDIEFVKQESKRIEKGSKTPPPGTRPKIRTR